MKITVGRPPNYDDIVRTIGRPPQAAVFAWGDVLYVGQPPHGMRHDISPDLMAHEETHGRQQRILPGGPPEWWDMWLHNPRFRLTQELAAYRVQLSTFATGGRQVRRTMLRHFAKEISAPMYGRIIKYADALEQLKEVA